MGAIYVPDGTELELLEEDYQGNKLVRKFADPSVQGWVNGPNLVSPMPVPMPAPVPNPMMMSAPVAYAAPAPVAMPQSAPSAIPAVTYSAPPTMYSSPVAM